MPHKVTRRKKRLAVRRHLVADTAAVPVVVDRVTFQAALDVLRVREKAHTHEGDVIAADRRRLPMVEVDPTTKLIGPHGPVTLLDTFEGRRMLIAYYFMWHTGHPAPEQCEGCTWVTTQVRELSYIHSRNVTALSENRITLGGQGHEATGQLEDFPRQPPRGGKRR